MSVSGSSNGNEFRYTGREDDGTAIYYYRARYYHPGLQRFISEDRSSLPPEARTSTRMFGTTHSASQTPSACWRLTSRLGRVSVQCSDLRGEKPVAVSPPR